ncbi:MAG: GNAT family N-acetyltransferase [Candidatus Thiodiazotropha sp.]|jgi:ribosomal protein S18 acetylase RimI-like enzyme
MLKPRAAEPADIESLLDLLEALFTIEQDFAPDRKRQRRGLEKLLAAKGAYVVVAEYEGEVVGMATIQTLISTAEGGPAGVIEDLVVSESHRGRGIGQAIMNHLLSWAEHKGLSRLQLLADRDNRPALKFYRKQGWSTTRLIALRKNR